MNRIYFILLFFVLPQTLYGQEGLPKAFFMKCEIEVTSDGVKPWLFKFDRKNKFAGAKSPVVVDMKICKDNEDKLVFTEDCVKKQGVFIFNKWDGNLSFSSMFLDSTSTKPCEISLKPKKMY